jgi:hypothetical protein
MNKSLAYLYLHTYTYIVKQKTNCNRHNLIIDDGKSIEIMCISNVHKYNIKLLSYTLGEAFVVTQKKMFGIKLFFFLVEISFILYSNQHAFT